MPNEKHENTIIEVHRANHKQIASVVTDKTKESEGIFAFRSYDTLDDTGAAKRFAVLNVNKLRYCDKWKKWTLWDGKKWEPDTENTVTHLATGTNMALLKYVALIKDPKSANEVLKYISGSGNAGRVFNMLRLAVSELPSKPDQYNNDQWVLNCNNGILDLKTRELRKHNPCDMITKLAPVDFDPAAECKKWISFLDQTFEGKADLIKFVQKAVGYTLTGDTGQQCLFMLYGEGENGKSCFINTVAGILGDYAQQTPIESFTVKQNAGTHNDIAALQSARFVSAVESESGKRLSESLIKQLTGNDRVTVRFLYGEYFTFDPEFKIWIATNHKPVIWGRDHAIWRRIRLIPFTHQVSEKDRIDRYENIMLAEESAGILNWALEGLRMWQAEGLKAPEEVTVATKEYRDEQDFLGPFLNDCCSIDKRKMAPAKDLYSVYTKWCEESGEKALSKTRLGKMLKERGFDSMHDMKGNTWLGIGINGED